MNSNFLSWNPALKVEIKSDLKSVESDFVSIEKLKKLGMKKKIRIWLPC